MPEQTKAAIAADQRRIRRREYQDTIDAIAGGATADDMPTVCYHGTSDAVDADVVWRAYQEPVSVWQDHDFFALNVATYVMADDYLKEIESAPTVAPETVDLMAALLQYQQAVRDQIDASPAPKRKPASKAGRTIRAKGKKAIVKKVAKRRPAKTK